MYIKCYSNQLNENLHQIYLWDDDEGYSTFKWEDKLGFDGMYPYQKFLIEKYGSNTNTSSNHQIMYFDIETEMIDFKEGKKDKENEFRKRDLISIVYYHQNEDKWCCLIVDEENKLGDYQIEGKQIIKFKNQKSLLKSFIKIINEIGVDILIGWNSDSFDIPFIYVKIKQLLGKKWLDKLSPIGLTFETNKIGEKVYTEYPIRIYGVESLDLMRIHKKIVNKVEEKYSLDYISNKYVGKNKISYDGNLYELYLNDIKKFTDYNFMDVELLVDLNDNRNYLPLVINFCHRGKVNYSDYFNGGRIIDGSITTEMIETYGLNSIPNLNKQLDLEDVIGGFIYLKDKGWMEYGMDNDFVSMYPTIIITLNIGIDTFRYRIKTDSFKWYGKYDDEVNMFLSLKELKKMNQNQTIVIEDKLQKLHSIKVCDLIDDIETNNISISSNGVCYSNDKISSQSLVLKKWKKERLGFKKLQYKYENEGNVEKEKEYQIKQQTLKILMNSIYGLNNLPTFRWGNSIIQNSITMSGRRMITEYSNYINKQLNQIGNQIEVELKQNGYSMRYNNQTENIIDIKPYKFKEGIKGKLFKKDEIKRKLFKWEKETI